MPRFPDYWAKRAAGLCVECPESSKEYARCAKCRARRQANRSYWATARKEGRSPKLIERVQQTKTPGLAADEAIAPLTRIQRQELIEAFRREYLHEDDVTPATLLAFRKNGLVYRERMDEAGGYVPGMYVPSPLGNWAAKRLLEGVETT